MKRNLKKIISIINILLLVTFLQKKITAEVKHIDSYFKENNKKYRIKFDPGNNLFFGGAYSDNYIGKKRYKNFQNFYFSLNIREKSESAFKDYWKKTYNIFQTVLNSGFNNNSNYPNIDVTVFKGNYIFYTPSSKITIGSSIINVPFLYGFYLELGRLYIPTNYEYSIYDVTPINAKILLDFLKSKSLNETIQLGFGIKYSISMPDKFEESKTEHKISPFTSFNLNFHFESIDGIWLFDANIDFSYWLSSRTKTWGKSYFMKLKLERIFLAINDHPINIFFNISYKYFDILQHNRNVIDKNIIVGFGLPFQID